MTFHTLRPGAQRDSKHNTLTRSKGFKLLPATPASRLLETENVTAAPERVAEHCRGIPWQTEHRTPGSPRSAGFGLAEGARL